MKDSQPTAVRDVIPVGGRLLCCPGAICLGRGRYREPLSRLCFVCVVCYIIDVLRFVWSSRCRQGSRIRLRSPSAGSGNNFGNDSSLIGRYRGSLFPKMTSENALDKCYTEVFTDLDGDVHGDGGLRRLDQSHCRSR